MNKPNELDKWNYGTDVCKLQLVTVKDNVKDITLFAFGKIVVVKDIAVLDMYSTFKDAASETTTSIFDKLCPTTDSSSIGFTGHHIIVYRVGVPPPELNETDVKRLFVNVYFPTTKIPAYKDTLAAIVSFCAGMIARACKFQFKNIDLNKSVYMVHAATETAYTNSLYIDDLDRSTTSYWQTKCVNDIAFVKASCKR